MPTMNAIASIGNRHAIDGMRNAMVAGIVSMVVMKFNATTMIHIIAQKTIDIVSPQRH
jgi:hypothetical protein